jgi:hypothetical protein
MSYIISQATLEKLKDIYPQIDQEACPVYAGLAWTKGDLRDEVWDELSQDTDVPELSSEQLEQTCEEITHQIFISVQDIAAEMLSEKLSDIVRNFVRKRFPAEE